LPPYFDSNWGYFGGTNRIWTDDFRALQALAIDHSAMVPYDRCIIEKYGKKQAGLIFCKFIHNIYSIFMKVIRIEPYIEESTCRECGGKCCQKGTMTLSSIWLLRSSRLWSDKKEDTHTGTLAMWIIDGLFESDRTLLPTLRVKNPKEPEGKAIFLNQFWHNNGECAMLNFDFSGAQDGTWTHTPEGIRTSNVRVYHSTTWAK
jgi:hypothetical protein